MSTPLSFAGKAGEGLAELLWPTRCVGCNLPGELLCDECRANLPWINQQWACPVCGAPHGWLTCTECGRSRNQDRQSEKRTSIGETWPTRAVICSFPFSGVGAAMVSGLKDRHELRLAPVMAAAMACSLDEAQAWDAPDGASRFDPLHIDALVFVPATSEAYARRGFDHMELVARSLSHLVEIPLHDVLVRVDSKDQRALGKSQRARNIEGTVSVAGNVTGLNLLLADDVITTGASVTESARALLERGASSVTACALARVC